MAKEKPSQLFPKGEPIAGDWINPTDDELAQETKGNILRKKNGPQQVELTALERLISPEREKIYGKMGLDKPPNSS